jgi:hypothetical protein
MLEPEYVEMTVYNVKSIVDRAKLLGRWMRADRKRR